MSSHPRPSGNLRVSAWNLLLLVPLFALVTPLFNHAEPRLFGMPFFYWFQFVGVPVGVACTITVYLKTRGPLGRRVSDGSRVDDLDEGSLR